MKLEEGAKARGCQCSVLVLLHLHLWGETPLLLPSGPPPTDTLLLRENPSSCSLQWKD